MFWQFFVTIAISALLHFSYFFRIKDFKEALPLLWLLPFLKVNAKVHQERYYLWFSWRSEQRPEMRLHRNSFFRNTRMRSYLVKVVWLIIGHKNSMQVNSKKTSIQNGGKSSKYPNLKILQYSKSTHMDFPIHWFLVADPTIPGLISWL